MATAPSGADDSAPEQDGSAPEQNESPSDDRPPWQIGDPIQVWKWPALLAIGFWGYLYSGMIGFAAGMTLASVLVFFLGTAIYRRGFPNASIPWWAFTICATVAGVFGGAIGLAVGNVVSGFIMVYVPLVTVVGIVVWVAHRIR